MEALASSQIPLRAKSMAILLAHREKRRQREEAKALYLGNVQYSILGSLHAMCKSELRMPSFGAFLAALDGKTSPPAAQTNADVLRQAEKNILMFLPPKTAGGAKPPE